MSQATESECSAIGTSLVVFLLGVAVGATLAALYAPAAGRETRESLAHTAERVKERASDIGHRVAERAGEIRQKVASLKHADAESEVQTGEPATS